ncbi:MAG: hypothetical protein OXD54_09150 [Candidatus Poribacteria bacterium]|nr:hypothetical protein [Candidatus Poribacteria bacterium]
MKLKVYCLCAVILMLGMPMLVLAQVQEDNLVGWWRFDSAEEETGNFGNVVLHGATIEDGQLVVSTDNWAHSLEYIGPDITELTLVSWLSLDDLARTSGSALTLDELSTDQFCGIVWAERVDRQWMPGSSHFRRTDDFPNVVTESETGVLHMVAITYRNDDNQYEITGYRNGDSMGSFRKGDLRTWEADDSEAIWGRRHVNGLSGPGNLSAHIEESRIYNVALTADEVRSLHEGGLTPVEPKSKLATQWGALKSK